MGAPLLLAGVIGGAVAFAQSGESSTPTPTPTEEQQTPATPSEGSGKADGRDCPEKNGGDSESGSGASTSV